MVKIGIVFNPEAQKNRLCSDLSFRINGYRTKKNVHAYRLTPIEDTERILSEYRDNGVGLIGISGGDGTQSRTIDRLIEVYNRKNKYDQIGELPIIFPLPGGNMNNFAQSAGIVDEQFKALEAIISKLGDKDKKEIPVTERQILDIYADGRKMHGFVLSNGCASNFLDAYNEIPPLERGAKEAFKLIYGCIISNSLRERVFEKADGKVYLDGELIYSGRYSGIAVSAIGGFRTAGLSFFHIKDGYLNALAANTSWIDVALQIPRFLLDIPIRDREDKKIVNKNVKNVKMIYDKEQSFNLDGDGGYKAKEIEIRLERKIKCLDYGRLVNQMELPCKEELERKCAYGHGKW